MKTKRKLLKDIKSNTRLIAVLCALILVSVILMPNVQAEDLTIAMANPSSISDRDIIVYFPNGSMQGYYNSTSVITLNTSDSLGYQFSLKPARTNPLEDPYDWVVNEAFPFLESNFIALAILGAVIGIVFRKWLI